MAKVAGGQQESIRFEITSDDEIGLLERMLNEMLSSAKFTGEALAEQKDRLEDRVRERTVELNKNRKIALNMMEDAEEARIQAERAKEKEDREAAAAEKKAAREKAAAEKKVAREAAAAEKAAKTAEK